MISKILAFFVCWATICDTQAQTSCYMRDNSKAYNGTVSITVTGKICQRWDAQYPHDHEFGQFPHDFVDQKLPENFCRDTRNGGDEGYPWCFTTDPKKRWEKCNVPLCFSMIVFINVVYMLYNTF